MDVLPLLEGHCYFILLFSVLIFSCMLHFSSSYFLTCIILSRRNLFHIFCLIKVSTVPFPLLTLVLSPCKAFKWYAYLCSVHMFQFLCLMWYSLIFPFGDSADDFLPWATLLCIYICDLIIFDFFSSVTFHFASMVVSRVLAYTIYALLQSISIHCTGQWQIIYTYICWLTVITLYYIIK